MGITIPQSREISRRSCGQRPRSFDEYARALVIFSYLCSSLRLSRRAHGTGAGYFECRGQLLQAFETLAPDAKRPQVRRHGCKGAILAMRISFIVLTYNRADALLAVLRSLAEQCSPNHQVVIADDGSRIEQVQLPKTDQTKNLKRVQVFCLVAQH